MKEVSTNHFWPVPWTAFTYANFNKYPNEHADHVVSVDVISRHLSPEGLLVTDRLLQLKQPIPSILRKIGLPFPETTYFLERSRLNPRTQHYEATSYNLSMRSFFQAIEICSFKSEPEKGGTQFQQRAQFTACSLFARIVEEVAVSRFESNAARGREGMESVLEKLKRELSWFSKEFDVGMEKVKSSMQDIETKMLKFEDQFTQDVKGLEQRIEVDVKEKIETLKNYTSFENVAKSLQKRVDGDWTSSFHVNPFC